MFDSIFTTSPTAAQFFVMALSAIVSGFIYAWIMSFKIRAKKRFFMVVAIVPFMVAAVIAFVKGNIGAGVAIGGAFSLSVSEVLREALMRSLQYSLQWVQVLHSVWDISAMVLQ